MSNVLYSLVLADGFGAYIQELLPDILERRIEPGRVFDF